MIREDFFSGCRKPYKYKPNYCEIVNPISFIIVVDHYWDLDHLFNLNKGFSSQNSESLSRNLKKY